MRTDPTQTPIQAPIQAQLRTLIDKLHDLPPERVAEVEDFVDFLRSRARTKGASVSRHVSLDFPVDHVNQWPEGLSLRREDMYGDDGR
ncbi:MAG: hypothetical protein AB1651_18700 [Pseudomonadota bacterium]